MPKTKISEYSTTNTDNSDIESINIAEGCAPSGINNAIRELMVHLKEFQTGSSGDPLTVAGGFVASGGMSANTLTLTGILTASGGTIMSGTNTMSGGNILSGTNTISGAAIISGNINSSGTTNTFSGGNIFSGTNTISGSAIISGNINSSGTNTFSGSNVMSFGSGTSASPSIYFASDTNTGIFSPAADTIAFAEGGAEAMRIDSDGDVGIGTTAPSQKLHLAGGSNRYMRVDVGTTAAGLVGGESNLFILGYNTVPSLNNVLDSSLGTGRLDFGNSSGGYIAFLTGATNTTPSERARITSGGDLLVGGTSSYGKLTITGSAAGTLLSINGAASQDAVMRWASNGTNKAIGFWDAANDRLYFANGASGGVYLSNGGTSWTSVSDERLKENLVDISDAVSKITSLRSVIGNYISDEHKKPTPFLIAQDVQAAFPEAVDSTNADELGLSYTAMIPLLVAAIKEQTTRIEALEAEVAALKGQ